jgi:hypothetical protein
VFLPPGLKKTFVKRVNPNEGLLHLGKEALVVQNCTISRLVRLIGRFRRKEKQADREKKRSHGDGMEIKGVSQHLLSWTHFIYFGFG